jgi:hypothetical protein
LELYSWRPLFWWWKLSYSFLLFISVILGLLYITSTGYLFPLYKPSLFIITCLHSPVILCTSFHFFIFPCNLMMHKLLTTKEFPCNFVTIINKITTNIYPSALYFFIILCLQLYERFLQTGLIFHDMNFQFSVSFHCMVMPCYKLIT